MPRASWLRTCSCMPSPSLLHQGQRASYFPEGPACPALSGHPPLALISASPKVWEPVLRFASSFFLPLDWELPQGRDYVPPSDWELPQDCRCNSAIRLGTSPRTDLSHIRSGRLPARGCVSPYHPKGSSWQKPCLLHQPRIGNPLPVPSVALSVGLGPPPVKFG